MQEAEHMRIEENDYQLIAEAQKVIRLNYDQEHHNHTVGAAVRCKNGSVYVESLLAAWGLRGTGGNRDGNYKRGKRV